MSGATLLMMVGSGASVLLPETGAYVQNIYPLTSNAYININSSGAWSTPNGSGTWLISGNAADYDIRCTVMSGALTGTDSGQGTWLNLATTRAWGCFQLGEGSTAAIVLLEISRTGLATVIETGTVNIYAEVLPEE